MISQIMCGLLCSPPAISYLAILYMHYSWLFALFPNTSRRGTPHLSQLIFWRSSHEPLRLVDNSKHSRPSVKRHLFWVLSGHLFFVTRRSWLRLWLGAWTQTNAQLPYFQIHWRCEKWRSDHHVGGAPEENFRGTLLLRYPETVNLVKLCVLSSLSASRLQWGAHVWIQYS